MASVTISNHPLTNQQTDVPDEDKQMVIFNKGYFSLCLLEISKSSFVVVFCSETNHKSFQLIIVFKMLKIKFGLCGWFKNSSFFFCLLWSECDWRTEESFYVLWRLFFNLTSIFSVKKTHILWKKYMYFLVFFEDRTATPPISKASFLKTVASKSGNTQVVRKKESQFVFMSLFKHGT